MPSSPLDPESQVLPWVNNQSFEADTENQMPPWANNHSKSLKRKRSVEDGYASSEAEDCDEEATMRTAKCHAINVEMGEELQNAQSAVHLTSQVRLQTLFTRCKCQLSLY